jgi:hypothetical protein
MKDIPSAFTRPALCNLHSCITLSFSAIDLFLLFTTAAATPLNSLYCSSHHSHCCSHLCWGTSVLVRQRVSAQRAPVCCILGCCLSNLRLVYTRSPSWPCCWHAPLHSGFNAWQMGWRKAWGGTHLACVGAHQALLLFRCTCA